MSGFTLPERIRRPRLWLAGAVIAILLVVVLALVARFGPWADAGFVEYRMPSKVDIPVTIAVARDGAVWFTIEMSDAIGRLKDGRIEKVRKGSDNLEPLGLAIDAEGVAVDRVNNVWYADLSGWVGMLRADRAIAE
jgi:virginiamycin B lyase